MVSTVDALRFVGVGLNLTVHALQFWLMGGRHRVLTYSIVLFFVVSIGLSVSLGICFTLDADSTSVSTAVYTLSLFLESVCTVHSNFVAYVTAVWPLVSASGGHVVCSFVYGKTAAAIYIKELVVCVLVVQVVLFGSGLVFLIKNGVEAVWAASVPTQWVFFGLLVHAFRTLRMSLWDTMIVAEGMLALGSTIFCVVGGVLYLNWLFFPQLLFTLVAAGLGIYLWWTIRERRDERVAFRGPGTSVELTLPEPVQGKAVTAWVKDDSPSRGSSTTAILRSPTLESGASTSTKS